MCVRWCELWLCKKWVTHNLFLHYITCKHFSSARDVSAFGLYVSNVTDGLTCLFICLDRMILRNNFTFLYRDVSILFLFVFLTTLHFKFRILEQLYWNNTFELIVFRRNSIEHVRTMPISDELSLISVHSYPKR